MRRDFDIFEKFPDGSTLWRACVPGRFEAQRKMQEFAEHSENEFYAIDIQAEDFLSVAAKAEDDDSWPSAKSATHG
jgi:hypothetical protein